MKYFLIPESDYNKIEQMRITIFDIINQLKLDTETKTYLTLSIMQVTNKLYYLSHFRYYSISSKSIILLIKFINWLKIKAYNLKKHYHCLRYCNKSSFMLLYDNSVVFFGEKLKYKKIKLNKDQLVKYFNPETDYNKIYTLNSDNLDLFESLYFME